MNVTLTVRARQAGVALNLAPSTRHVLRTLLEYVPKAGDTASASLATIMRDTGYSRGTVITAIADLQHRRLVERLDDTSGRGHIYHLKLTIPGYGNGQTALPFSDAETQPKRSKSDRETVQKHARNGTKLPAKRSKSDDAIRSKGKSKDTFKGKIKGSGPCADAQVIVVHDFSLTSPEPREPSLHHRVETYIRNLVREITGRDVVWGDAEGSQLKRFLRAAPGWTYADFEKALTNWAYSDLNHSARPCTWIPKLSTYSAGPVDRFNNQLGVKHGPTKADERAAERRRSSQIAYELRQRRDREREQQAELGRVAHFAN